MKLNAKHTFAFFALMALLGCTQDVIDDESHMPVAPEHGYILFNTGISTRGTLIEGDMLQANFSVLGYSYTGEWSAAKALAKPDVFYKQEVVWDGTVHSYDTDNSKADKQLKQWEAKKKYSFFAYYPTSLTPSSADKEGNPYIDFTFPRNNIQNHVDVMTAHVIDTDAGTPNVSLTMQHRLTAIDVLARNLNDLWDPDGDTDIIKGNEKDVYVEIKNMSITFDNLIYDKVRIPLNATDEPSLDYSAYGMASTRTATYQIFSNGGSSANNLRIDPITGNDSESTSITEYIDQNKKQKTTMIVIPQDRYIDTNGNGVIDKEGDVVVVAEDFTLQGSFTFTYDYVDENGHSLGIIEESKKTTTRPFRFPKDLKPGRRYYILLNFSRGAITIAFVESDEWKDNDIYYEFE